WGYTQPAGPRRRLTRLSLRGNNAALADRREGPPRNSFDPRLWAQPGRVGHLVAVADGSGGDNGRTGHAARAAVDHIDALVLDDACQTGALLGAPADVVLDGEPQKQRLVQGPLGADGLHHLHAKAHSVELRAAVLVVAAGGGGGEGRGGGGEEGARAAAASG